MFRYGPYSILCQVLVLLTVSTTNNIAHVSGFAAKKIKPAQWIACASTKDVNKAIDKFIREGDIVAELGSQLRDTSTHICDRIGPDGKALLVDIERKFPNEKKTQKRTLAMRREEDEDEFYTDRVKFVTTKSFEFWRDALFFQGFDNGDSDDSDDSKSNGGERPKYNALVVDVSTVAGNDLDLTCISLVREFLALNQGSGEDDNSCRVVIIKSGSLHTFARKLFHAQRIFTGAETLEDNNPGETSFIGTVGVDEYRRTIPYAVKEGDAVIEVGSHFGTSTTLLHDAAKGSSPDGVGGCIGVDVGPSIIESAKKKFPHVPFCVGDAWKTAELARMKGTHLSDHPSDTYDVVYVDVGGLSGSEGLLEAISLLAAIENSLEPRCIVIKSVCIRRLASSLVAYSNLWKKEMLQKQ